MPKGLIFALQFLTIFPVKTRAVFDARKMAPYFPVAGLVLGMVLAAFDMAVHQLWPRPVASLLDIALLVILTGALHIDGTADTGDGLFSHQPRARALAIMKDSCIGAMGMVSVLVVLSLKYAGLCSVDGQRWLILLIIPAYARSGPLFAIRCLPYGRPEGGTGEGMFDSPLGIRDFTAMGIPLVLSAILGISGIVLNAVFMLFICMFILFYRKKMGCITGDMMGAMIETSEAVLFLTVAATR